VTLDPHVRRLISALAMGRANAPASPSLQQRRESFGALMALAEIGTRVARVEDRVLPGPAGAIGIRVYTPTGATAERLPGLVFLHGGGFVCGSLATHDPLCRTLCAQTGCRLIAVDYRLAPEHVFPAALADAHAATQWVLDHAGDLMVDPARVAIAGDSAGATLAAVVCQLLAQRPGAPLAAQLLLCPILDWSAETPSRRSFAQGYLLDTVAMAQELACYLPAGQDPAQPHVSPLRADLRGQPRAFLHTAEFDPLHDEGQAYADRLRLAGVAVEHTSHPGMVHLFYGLGSVVPYARDMLRQVGAQIRGALHP
jgi:acetyl esterase/lipase